MATGEFYTMTIWEVRPGFQGRELEYLTEQGIVPQYGKVPGVKAVQLFRIDEGEDINKYIAVVIYESREAYNRWWTQDSNAIQSWQAPYTAVSDRWLSQTFKRRDHRATLVVEQEFERPEDKNTPKPQSGQIRQIF